MFTCEVFASQTPLTTVNLLPFVFLMNLMPGSKLRARWSPGPLGLEFRCHPLVFSFCGFWLPHWGDGDVAPVLSELLGSEKVLEVEERLSRGDKQTYLWLAIGERPDRCLGIPEAMMFRETHASKQGVGFTSWTVLSPGFGGRAYRHLTLTRSLTRH